MSELWGIADSRTGRRVSVTAYPTEASAAKEIASMRKRDERGIRPDVHELMPYLVPCLITDANRGYPNEPQP